MDIAISCEYRSQVGGWGCPPQSLIPEQCMHLSSTMHAPTESLFPHRVRGMNDFINPHNVRGVKHNREYYKAEPLWMHDRMYAGFKTLDQEEDGECPRITHSGWWFAIRESMNVFQPEPQKGNCFHDVETDTNLNGMYDDDPKKNQRAIILCKENNVYDCIKYEGVNFKYAKDYSKVTFNNIESVKLKQTRMYLGRRK